MPDKPATEAQFGRLLAGGDRPVRVVLALPDGYRPQSADPGHVERYYRPWSEIDRQQLDGVVITGAPVEQLAYRAVRYWTGLTAILDWLTAARVPAIHVCRSEEHTSELQSLMHISYAVFCLQHINKYHS